MQQTAPNCFDMLRIYIIGVNFLKWWSLFHLYDFSAKRALQLEREAFEEEKKQHAEVYDRQQEVSKC